MITISPSLLSANFLNLESEIKTLNNIDNLWLHLDIMDGHFVPNLTFGKTVLKNIPQLTTHKLDAHFMVTNPNLFLDIFKDFPLHNFTFHFESLIHHDPFIDKCKKSFPSVGLALNPSTSLDLVPHYLLEKIDVLLIMTVSPGFGGQTFIDGVLTKIHKAFEIKKNHNYTFEIQVDGGINEETAKLAISSGATNLVAGNFIFSEPNHNYEERINLLRS